MGVSKDIKTERNYNNNKSLKKDRKYFIYTYGTYSDRMTKQKLTAVCKTLFHVVKGSS